MYYLTVPMGQESGHSLAGSSTCFLSQQPQSRGNVIKFLNYSLIKTTIESIKKDSISCL